MSDQQSRTGSDQKTNRLADETSPYLLQHRHNPVDWFPWGTEALALAKAEDRPIFLSIGYSACHWCHVMERESFENDAIAGLMNEHFVNIKVDREERPDLDNIYMAAVQAMTGHGGWPMSVFLTPDLKPFFGGTYYPPTDSRGMPSFPRVLLSVSRAWRERRSEIEASAGEMTEGLRAIGEVPAKAGVELSTSLIDNAARTLARSFDATHGGFGSAPKFPHPMDLRVLLLRHHVRTDDAQALHGWSGTDARQDGPRRDLRPPRRRLFALLHRRPLAGPPLREDALRQRPAGQLTYLEAFQVTGRPDLRPGGPRERSTTCWAG